MALPQLTVSRVVNVSVSIAPLAARLRNRNAILAGGSDVIDVTEGIRDYPDIVTIAADFGTSAPEYLSAVAYFSQSPQPATLKIARWAQSATLGLLKGATLTPAQQLLTAFTSITAGSMTLLVDSAPVTISTINLSTATTLPGIANIISTALGITSTCLWNGVLFRFEIRSYTSGALSSVNYPGASALSTALGLTQASGASVPVAGIAAETPLAFVSRLANISNDWYALFFAAVLSTSDVLAVAGFIEAASPSRIFGHSSANPLIVDPTSALDSPSQMKAANFRRSMTQYTTSANPYVPIAALISRAITVDYTGSNTALTLKFKQEPGIASEYISATAANALEAKNCNVFAHYDNGTSIIEQGVMADGSFIDEVINLDWLQNAVQTDVFNYFYTSNTKIPQTDAGVHGVVTVIENRLAGAVTNGVLAPGLWTVQGFGQLLQGDYLPKGYYVFAPPIALQAQADREARKMPLLQVAVKMAGAVHFSNVAITVNR